MRFLKTIALGLLLRINRQVNLSLSAYVKGVGSIEFGRQSRVHDWVTLDAGRGGKIVLGDRVTLNRYVILNGGRQGIRLGNGVEINNQTILDGTGGIDIGDRTLIGPGVKLISYQHRFEGRHPVAAQASDALPIRIDQDVWIGANVIILAGVSIGEGAVIGAGAVVTADIPAWGIAVGVPARVIRMRDSGSADL